MLYFWPRNVKQTTKTANCYFGEELFVEKKLKCWFLWYHNYAIHTLTRPKMHVESKICVCIKQA